MCIRHQHRPIPPKEGESLVAFENSDYFTSNQSKGSPTSSNNGFRQSKLSAHITARRQLKDAEYVIHEDPLVQLDPKVMQLLNEK
jgi:hypothetical protein